MITKTFKEAEIKDLINQVSEGKISFSRMVEILNSSCYEKMLIEINDIFNKYSESNKNGGYSKMLRNKRTDLEVLLFKGDIKLKAAWYVSTNLTYKFDGSIK